VTTTVLGISAFYHDAAAALVRDGVIIAAAQEERFSRRKHDPGFPSQAIDYCLGEAFVEMKDLDAVVFYDNPVLTLDRALQSIAAATPGSRAVWDEAAIPLLGTTLLLDEVIRNALGHSEVPLLFSQHHLSHAASAFYPSPFERAAVLAMDGVGEWATTSLSVGDGNDLEIVAQIDYPHSLGLLYSAFTFYCGFKVNSGEYKLMGLAPYGEPRYESLIRDHLIEFAADGSYHLDMSYFGYLDSDQMTNDKFDELMGGPARRPESTIERRHMDLAASIQAVTETGVLGLARHARDTTGMNELCLAGGVALNCVANGVLAREQIFDRIWIQPAAGDAGGALGAALLASHTQLGVERLPRDGRDTQRGSYLGISYNNDEARAVLDDYEAVYEEIVDLDERSHRLAGFLDDGKIIGFFNGPMEFGPRSLGGRSIIGDPRNPEMQVSMNLQIKYRESFRPFAPSVLDYRAPDYFEIDDVSPYMLLVAPVRKEMRLGDDQPMFENDDDADMMSVVRQARSSIPAVTHVDHSARVQTVRPDDNKAFRRLLECFDERTGCGVVVNTSFNVRGEPIVASPRDAYRCFMRTEMDVLIVEDLLLLKADQPTWKENDAWMDEFELD
jgi:carbamoyltransferase